MNGVFHKCSYNIFCKTLALYLIIMLLWGRILETRRAMKKLVLLIAFISLVGFVNAQNSCPNADFSMGDFTNWIGTTGTYSATNGVYDSTGGIVIGNTNENTYEADTGRQTLISQSQTDPETGNILNELPPIGGYAVRLGNPRTGSCDGGTAQEEQLSYTYTPTSSSCIFTYQYAVVLHDPGSSASHTQYTRPSFVIQILNSAGSLIDSACGYYTVNAVAGIPGFNTCSPDPLDICDNTDDVLWKDWTSVSIDLTAYIGNSVTINFATRDCNPSGHAGKHFGYAYFSCSCSPLKCTEQCLGNYDIITAPAGFASYQWSGGPSTQSDSIHNPVAGNVYTCLCTAVSGCSIEIKDTVSCSTSIDVFSDKENIDIYPNPVTNNLQIEINSEVRSENAELKIYDVVGNLLFGKSIATNKTTLDVSSFANGVYVIKATTGKGVVVKKFIKE